MQANDQHALHEALTKLETALLTPIVSGELASWVRTAQQATAGLGAELKTYVGSTQRRQYSQIASSDPELLAKVQQLRQEDQELLAEYAAVEASLSNLSQLAAAAKKDESRAEERRADVEKQGLALILRVKKHQVAADTWLSEAIYRDRGVGD